MSLWHLGCVLGRACVDDKSGGMFNKLPGTKNVCSGEHAICSQVAGHQRLCSGERVGTERRRVQQVSLGHQGCVLGRACVDDKSGGVFNKFPVTKVCVLASALAQSGGVFNK